MRPERETEIAGRTIVLEGEIDPPPSAADFEALRERAGGRLPPDYVDAIRAVDGFAASFGEPDEEEKGEVLGYIIFYSCRRVVRTAESYGLAAGGDALLPVGSDGGGEIYAIDLLTQEWVMVNRADLETGNGAFRFKDLATLLDALGSGTAFDGH